MNWAISIAGKSHGGMSVSSSTVDYVHLLPHCHDRSLSYSSQVFIEVISGGRRHEDGSGRATRMLIDVGWKLKVDVF